jgi:hypothetical protein
MDTVEDRFDIFRIAGGGTANDTMHLVIFS